VIKPKKTALIKKEQMKKVCMIVNTSGAHEAYYWVLIIDVETLRWADCSHGEVASEQSWTSRDAAGRKEGEGGGYRCKEAEC
jgi:hypothetical protein